MKPFRYLAAAALLTFAACGGGGGDGGSSATPTRSDPLATSTITPTPDPNATPTPTPPIIAGSALFVRASTGDDANDGRDPGQAFKTIGAAVAALPSLSSGRTIVVGPGTYSERLDDLPGGDEGRPVVLFADPTGASTQEGPGGVVLLGSGSGSMIKISERQFVEIDGFIIRGASGGNNAGIDIRSSSNITVRNCEISDGSSQADGVAILNSSDVLIVNNLIFDNGRRGVRIAGSGAGSRGVRLINNTIANNDGQGAVVGTSNTASEASLLFNILQNNISNQGLQIVVTDPSLDLFASDTNLVFPARYSPPEIQQEFDIASDALFVDDVGGVFLLSSVNAGQSSNSPAIDAGFADAFPEDLLDELTGIRGRTTTASGEPDTGELDLGYHSPAGGAGPIPVARTFYVRESGDDDRSSGRSPDDAFRNIRTALGIADAGDTVIVGPGAYDGRLLVQTVASEDAPLTVFADPTGVLTDDAPGAVAVDAAGRGVGFRVIGSSWVVIDGFTVLGAADSAIEIRSSSSHVTVRNCFIDGLGSILDGVGDGITVDDSDDVTLVNNAVSFNDGNGIQVRRSDRARIINNTVAENGVRGIRVGSGTLAAADAVLQNNIINFNGQFAIEFNAASAETATLAYNLVFPGEYRPPSTVDLPRPSDIIEDAGFVGFANFLLASDSPARNAADPGTDSAIVEDLATRTTSENETPDSDRLDIGYHFPILPPDPTPTPGRGR